MAKFTLKQREAFEAAALELRKVEHFRAPREAWKWKSVGWRAEGVSYEGPEFTNEEDKQRNTTNENILEYVCWGFDEVYLVRVSGHIVNMLTTSIVDWSSDESTRWPSLPPMWNDWNGVTLRHFYRWGHDKEYNDLTKDVERCTKIPIFFKYYICKGLFALCKLNASETTYQKRKHHSIATHCDGNDFSLFQRTVTHGVL